MHKAEVFSSKACWLYTLSYNRVIKRTRPITTEDKIYADSLPTLRCRLEIMFTAEHPLAKLRFGKPRLHRAVDATSVAVAVSNDGQPSIFDTDRVILTQDTYEI